MKLIPRSWASHHHGRHGPEPHHSSGISRRQVLGTAAGLVVGAGLSPSARALGGNPHVDASPLPIPGGVSPFGIFIHHFTVIPNSAPLSVLNDPSHITDFNGFVGHTRIRGTGSSSVGALTFQADMGFTDGVYVAKDGKHYHATFGFI
jgi:hypothetical protein